MESESDFDASSGDEWEETSESSSSDEEVIPVPARRYAASTEDVPAEAAASTGGMFGASSPRRSRVCRVCSERDKKEREREGSSRKLKQKRSSYWCEKCQVTLCVTPCFEKFHTLPNYWE
ncbi:uncharacterized protein LOC144432148 [Styela clava]